MADDITSMITPYDDGNGTKGVIGKQYNAAYQATIVRIASLFFACFIVMLRPALQIAENIANMIAVDNGSII